MSKDTLVREDWNDISKLTFRDAPLCKIIEVKVLESFIGLKPYPVIVVMNTPVSGIIAKQYTLEGEAESKSKDSEDFQIVKVKEPEPVNYEEIVKELMIKGVFVSRHKRIWTRIEACNLKTSEFYLSGHWSLMHTIKDYGFSFDLFDFYDFNDYLQITGKP
jgi:hypothetical protein